MLLKAGANVYACDKYNLSAVDFANGINDPKKRANMLQLLEDHKGSVLKKNDKASQNRLCRKSFKHSAITLIFSKSFTA